MSENYIMTYAGPTEASAYEGSGGLVDPGSPQRTEGPMAQAGVAFGETNILHKMLEDLESKLFGPTPAKNVTSSGESSSGPPSLESKIKATRQRLETATSRLGSILGRL